jgi:triosephosphate isomerase
VCTVDTVCSSLQVAAALGAGLNVLPCLGEQLHEREEGRTMEVPALHCTALPHHGGPCTALH